jgi:integrase
MALHCLVALDLSRDMKPGRYSDGGGLCLAVNRNGSRSWVFRYMLNRRQREMGLGSFHAVSLSEARKRAAECRLLKSAGTDPIEARHAKWRAAEEAKLEAERAGITFRQCAEAYIEAYRHTWTNNKHAEQLTSSLKTYAYPSFGDTSVQTVDTDLVLKVLEPMAATKSSTAARLRGRIENILDWAKAKGHRTGENPARWRGHIAIMLPRLAKSKVVRHHKALPYREIKGFMEELSKQDCTTARALELLILTATRTSETLLARWQEIDLNAGIWTIPAGRMKARKEHRIPLSMAAQDMLSNLARDPDSDFVFPGAKRGKPLCHIALLSLLRRIGYAREITPHGFRSTFRDWAAEQTDHSPDVAEMALAHTISNKVEAAYRRGDLFEKRKALMEDWSRYCTGVQPDDVIPHNIIDLHRTA